MVAPITGHHPVVDMFGAAPPTRNNVIQGGPVSYTHLDVYKRQVVVSVDEGSVATGIGAVSAISLGDGIANLAITSDKYTTRFRFMIVCSSRCA